MTPFELFDRGASTLVASWTEYARGAVGASLVRVPGAALAVFTEEPESLVYNNALLDLGLDDDARAAVVAAMEEEYAEAYVDRYAAWVHEGDSAMRADLERRGYEVTESTRAMGIALEFFEAPRPELDVAAPEWAEYVALLGLGDDFQAYANPAAYVVRIALLDGRPAAVGMSYDHDGDCGIYNVTTLDHARGRGIGTALTAQLLHEARDRGCTTSTLQSTPMAERVYARLGFRDIGRYLEHTPGWAVA
ncbi:MAG: GNAT family N-acetyltransferase [Nocardioides sp.]